jgi:hypothetical protein
MDKRKALVLSLLGAIILVVIYIVYIWNRAPETVDKKEGAKITAEALTKAFLENEQNANAVYLNKVLEVKGIVAELSNNQDGKMVALLAAEDPLSGVQCTMRDATGILQWC